MTTLWQASQQLLTGQANPETLTNEALDAIAAESGEGKRVFTKVYAVDAQQQAQQASVRWRQHQQRSPIDGLPISIKDLFDVAGETTCAGSSVLVDAPAATVSASMVQRLELAGAAIVGKTNMTEFAFSGLGINPHYGTPANPWQRAEKRIPGGSSSGAAVAVTDGMCLAAVGTDTGGSVRIPAALCGLTGFKPSASRVMQTGTLPLSVALDSIGVIAHDVRSCWLLDSVIAEQPLTLNKRDLAQACFAIPQTRVLDNLDVQVSTAWQHSLKRLREQGVTLVELPLQELAELEVMNARGGITAYEAWQWHQHLVQAQPEAYDPQVLARIKRGRLLSADDAQALYQQRADWKQRVERAVVSFDGLLMPTVPLIAPPLAELDDPERYTQVNLLMLRNTSVINMLDGCAISLPCHQPGTAPVGLMLASTHGNDAALLSWAAALESTLKRSL
ncbi:amidase [Gibbsiella quercinecans]|uniref:amidase n=1 Tax=Gibbsiella quercinecans TaxID=929813 RepID=UPI000EF14DFA|nr:amidase [Gibbsiella quercinecans]RLM10174.1 amidase [Gibbsiella quercinecans]